MFAVSTSKQQEMVWLTIQIKNSKVRFERIGIIALPANSKAIFDCQYLEQDGLLALGCRNGHLYIYQLLPEDLSTFLQPIVLYKKLHGNEALSSIFFRKEADSCWEILTAGRDGFYVTLSLERVVDSGIQPHLTLCAPGWKLYQTSRTKHTKGYLEKIYQVNGSILLCGSHDYKLFILEESKKIELFNISPGGPASSRIWDFRAMTTTLSHFALVFIKDGTAYFYSRRPSTLNKNLLVQQNQQLVHHFNPKPLDSYHSQETRAVIFLPVVQDIQKENLHIVVSGGEDEMLTFHLINSHNLASGMKKLGSNRTHQASIRSLCHVLLSRPGNSPYFYLFSAGSEQRLMAWKVKPKYSADSSLSEMHCVAIASAPQTSSIFENRVMDLSAERRKGRDVEGGANEVIVATANSDRFLRLWVFREATKDSVPNFEMLAENSAHQRCVQKSKLVVRGSDLFLFSSATDGVLMMWDIEDSHTNGIKMHLRHQWKLHQSGVKGMDVQLFDSEHDDIICVATGGDDGRVCFLQVNLADPVSQSSIFAYERAHGSSVVATYILSRSTFLSVSSDQRINQYQISGAKDQLAIQCIDMIDIADPSDVAYVHLGDSGVGETQGLLVVVGHGCQLFSQLQ